MMNSKGFKYCKKQTKSHTALILSLLSVFRYVFIDSYRQPTFLYTKLSWQLNLEPGSSGLHDLTTCREGYGISLTQLDSISHASTLVQAVQASLFLLFGVVIAVVNVPLGLQL